MTSWVITVPKITNWDDYQKELDSVVDGSSVLNYRVRYFPKDMCVGDRCYIVWNGKVRGWMEITGMDEVSDIWECSTTGTIWPAGNYIQRSGLFNKVDGPDMVGFRGVRKYYD